MVCCCSVDMPFLFIYVCFCLLVSPQVAKNKIAPPFRVVEMDILFGTGIDTVSCLLDAAEDAGIFTRKGSWYSYDGKNVAQVGTAGLPLWWRLQSTFDVVAAKSKVNWYVRERLTRESTCFVVSCWRRTRLWSLGLL